MYIHRTYTLSLSVLMNYILFMENFPIAVKVESMYISNQ